MGFVCLFVFLGGVIVYLGSFKLHKTKKSQTNIIQVCFLFPQEDHNHGHKTSRARFDMSERESGDRTEGFSLDGYSTSVLLMTFLFLTRFSLM